MFKLNQNNDCSICQVFVKPIHTIYVLIYKLNIIYRNSRINFTTYMSFMNNRRKLEYTILSYCKHRTVQYMSNTLNVSS